MGYKKPYTNPLDISRAQALVMSQKHDEQSSRYLRRTRWALLYNTA